MFFGGLFLAYMLYRVWYPEAWAEASLELNIVLGGINTVGAHRQQSDDGARRSRRADGLQRATVGWLILTMVLGLVFLVIKYFEYAEKFEHHHVPGPSSRSRARMPDPRRSTSRSTS